jgi:adenosylcobinamide kinase/adenosylcobinamide-phosphate guanylyltransferase
MNDHDDATNASLLPDLTLVLGGARSGKSHYAETLVVDHAAAAGVRPVYVATAEAGDAEMLDRIAEHQARRDTLWSTVETLIGLDEAIKAQAGGDRPLLVDSLTLWLSNVLHAGIDPAGAVESLLVALDTAKAPIVCVSDEVGLGLVPDNALARSFRDALGRLNQRLASQADRVVFVVAGLPLTLKDDA